MDLRHPLRSLVPSLDWAVLEVLAATQSSLGVSQIARLSSSGSRKGLAAVLDRMVEHGLVIAEPANQGFIYRFNREHLLAPAVLVAVGIRAELLRRLEDEAAKLAPPPAHASVFGSFARGEAGVESDIDILLLARSESDSSTWDTQIDLLQERVRSWTGNRCRCLVFTVERARQLAADGEPIVANWIEDGLLLTGEPLQLILTEDAPTRAGRAHRRALARRSS